MLVPEIPRTVPLKRGSLLIILSQLLTTPLWAQASAEAPELAELVRQSKLPPVAERVSEEPEVINYGEVGSYGGVIRFDGGQFG